MRRSAILLAMLLSMAQPTPAQTAARNLLSNPGFETSDRSSGKPDGGWIMNYGDAHSRMTVQSGDARSGDRCLRLEAPTLPQNNPSVSAEQTVPVQAGHSYTLRAWVRNATGAEGLLAIVWQDKDRNWISHAGSGFQYTPEWSLQRVTGTAPKGAAFGVARIDIRSTGTAWLDDVVLCERKAYGLASAERSGEIRQNASVQLHWRVVDDEGLPIVGENVAVRVTGGDAALKPVASAKTFTSDEAGGVAVSVRVASKPGVVCTVTASADGATGKLEMRTTATGRPTSYQVEPATYAPLPGRPVRVAVRLLGAFLEPLPLAGRRVAATLEGSSASIAVPGKTIGADTLTIQAPTTLFAKFVITVRDGSGVAGKSAPVVVSPPMRQDAVRVGPNGYFVHANGNPFLPFGGLYANRVHTVSGLNCGGTVSDAFTDATDQQLRQWFAYLKTNGVTALRGMLRNHTPKGAEPLDIIGQVNEPLLERWEHMMSIGRQFGIRFLLTLHESWYATYAAYFNRRTMEDCVLPHYTPEQLASLPAYRRRFLVEKRMLTQTSEPMTDPDVLACQRDYLADLIPRLRNNPDVFAYEIENEQDTGYMEWTNEQIAQVRRYDAVTPICVSHLGGGLLSADPIPWSRHTAIDFYTYHIYPSGAQTSADRDYGTAVAATARYIALGKPAMAGEAFGDEWYKATPEARHLGGRDCVWSQILGGNIGAFYWDTVDEPIKELRLAHSLAVRAGVGTFKPARAALGIDVRPYVDDDTRFQRKPGSDLFVAMCRSAAICFRRGVDYDFTLNPERYAVSVRYTDIGNFASMKPMLEVTPGWEAQFIRSKDGTHLLAYVRNVGGSEPIQEDVNSGWTRKQANAELRIRLHLPLAARTIATVDLDTGAERTFPYRPGIAVDLGVTGHDYALLALR